MAEQARQNSADSTMRWIWRGSALAVLLIGWAFILVQNNFHVTAPVVVVSLGFLAGVAAIYTLFRTGASAVATNEEDDGDAAWGKPMGATSELEREKRALLKAIKEAEFDLQMGKLSKKDADEMIAVYRARAIEVIKQIDIHTSAGQAGTVREKILREARARLEIEVRAKGEKPVKAGKADRKQQQRADALGDAVSAAKSKQASKPDRANGAAVEAEPNGKAKVEDAVKDADVADDAAVVTEAARESAVATADDKVADHANGVTPTADAAAEDPRPDRESKEAAT